MIVFNMSFVIPEPQPGGQVVFCRAGGKTGRGTGVDVSQKLEQRIEEITQMLRERLKLRVSGAKAALVKARPQLPRQLRRHADALAGAVGLMAHPKLRQTLDQQALLQSADAVFEHLSAIDLADRRKGFWLGVLGSIAFGMITVFALVVVVLVWRDVV